ncbi:MAG TPA: hypothetical protein VK864_08045 [Longimicrobiales bacterium]|nr:hypothetical protein [Longimicrobiales bacterium]
MRISTLLLSFALAGCGATAAQTIGWPAADADETGSLTMDEFTYYWNSNELFERMDDNDNGCVSRKEYTEFVQDEYEGDVYFNGLDDDHDGTICRQEMIPGWYNMFDTDKDGILSRHEFNRSIDALEPELE